jgi:RNA polymerase sigma-70 factor (ECF subfamily)
LPSRRLAEPEDVDYTIAMNLDYASDVARRTPPELRAFIDAYRAPLDPSAHTNVTTILARIDARARSAWPSIHVDAVTFAAYIGVRANVAASDLMPALESMDTEGLYLACACNQRAPGAIETFVSSLEPEIQRALAQMGVRGSQQKDQVSRLFQVLLFGESDGKDAALGSYGGRGPLRGWARSIAVKMALTLRREDRRLVSLDDEHEWLDIPAGDTTPEIAYLRNFYFEAFREALARAIHMIATRDRNLLRQHYLDGLTLDNIARVNGVHRATAARWLANARNNVLARTREELVSAMRLSPSELASMLTFVGHTSSLADNVQQIKEALAER